MRSATVRHLGIGRLIAQRLLGAGHDRHAGLDRRLPRRGLAAHQRDRFRRRADERQAGIAARGGEVFVLGEETVARMHGVGAGLLRGVDDRVDAQVAFARRARADRPRLVGEPHVQRGAIAFRIHRGRGDAHVAARTNHAHGDLAAIGDQDLLHQTEPLTILSFDSTDWPICRADRRRPARERRERRSAWARNRRSRTDSR